MKDFVNLHAHTNLGSMLDALIGVDELFDKAAELDQKAIAITDHGTLAAHLDAFWAYKRTGIKFIPGCEMYYVNSYDFLPIDPNAKRKIPKTEKRKHLVLLAQNHTGYKNLLKLNYISFQNHVVSIGKVYPRINWRDLSQHTEGLICTSACANGPLSYLIINEQYDKAAELAQQFTNLFSNRFFIEIQPHLLKNDKVDQDFINRQLISIANKYGIPLITGVDIHYATKNVEKYHDVLLAINAKKPVDDPTRHRYGIDEFYVKSGDEVYSFLEHNYGKRVAEEAVSNTVKVANICDAPEYMEPIGNHLPIFKVKETSDYEEFCKWHIETKLKNKSDDVAYMRFKCLENFKKKFISLSKEERKFRWKRVLKELEILEGNNFSSYMLVVSDFIKWAKDNSILVGIGRGCLTKDTFIQTSNGFKELDKVAIGDLVLTHKGRFREVKETFKYSSKETLIEVTTDYSFMPIKLTSDHKVYAKKNGFLKNKSSFIPISDLNIGDFIFMPFCNKKIFDITCFDLSKYCESFDKILTNKIILHNNHKISRYLVCNENFCYIIGKWIKNGFILDNNSSIVFNEDLEKIYSYFDNLGFKCSILDNKLYIYSNILIKLFRDLFPNYRDSSSTKSFGIFTNLPKNKSKQIILGIKDSNEYIISDSLSLVNDIRRELFYFKIPNNVLINDGKYRIEFSGIESPLSNELSDRIFRNGYYVKILKKNFSRENFVYDLYVDEDNSYVTQNFAVHNSVGGSMVAYLLGIHGVDPIEYGLLFERFQNAYKKDLPDIDTDFTSAGRDLVKEYCKKRYGYENCVQVSNINTYTPKNVIPDLVKSMRNVLDLVRSDENYITLSNKIKEAIPDFDEDKKKIKSLESAIEISPKLREFAISCPELMEYADAIIGLPKEYSTHAAGMVISDIPVKEFAPVRIDKNQELAMQYEKNRCEAIGLVKMDFLAISTLDIIDESLKNIKRLDVNGPKKVEDIPLNNKETYNMIQQGYTKCVFQLGKSNMMISLCKLIKPQSIVDIAMINALGRPSSSNEERNEYAKRRFGKEKVTYLHTSLEDSLKETYGLGIFEEQLMGVAQDVAGWDLNKADGLRKLTKLKGKNPKLALQLEVEFIEGSMKKHSISYEKAKEIWDKVVLPFAGYGFNKSHAVFYSINGYITAYLKCNYPSAFLAAYLKIKSFRGGLNRDEEITMAKNECRRIGIKIMPPDINRSSAGYEILDDKTIVMGFSAIKGMGDKAINEIVSKQPFISFIDFLHRVDARVVNKSKLEVLAKAGCFDSMNLSRKAIYNEGKKIRDKFVIFLRRKIKDGYESEIILDEFHFSISNDEWSLQEKLLYEQEVLTELVSGTIKDLFPGFFTGVNITPISQLKILPNRHNIVTEFLVKSSREFKIKNGKHIGKSMIKYIIEDIFGIETELTVWPSEYKEAKELIKGNLPVRAKCQVNEFNNTKTLILQSIEKVYEM